METLLALLILLVPLAAIAAFAVIVIRRSLKRRARERRQGTFRNPRLLTGFGWVLGIIGGFFLLISLGSRSGAAEGFSPDEGMIGAAVIFVAGVVWAFVYGRRHITVWGERVDYQPFFAGKRTIWAMDAVRTETASNGRVTTFYIKGRDGRAASWYRSIFPPRTVAAFEHGVHHNAVEADSRRMPLLGMVPFTVDETLEMPDGTVATWQRDRTVQLDILASTPNEELLRAVEHGLPQTLRSLPRDAQTDALLRTDGVPDGHGGSVEGARIHWHRRPGKSAIDARILASGENGLDNARRAYSWLKTQLVEARKQQLGGSSRRGASREAAFSVTYRETWT